MADFTLTRSQRLQLIQIMNMRGGWDSDPARRNFFSDTYGDTLPNLQFQVAISGATHEFSQSLLRELEKQGALPNSRRHALYLLLRHLRVLASGWEHELAFIEELLDTLDEWAQQPDNTQSPTNLSPAALKKFYDEAVRLFGQKQWEEVLQRVVTLEAHGYTQDRLISLVIMKQRATDEVDKAQRRRNMEVDYQHIVALTKLPDMKDIAVQTWANFREEYGQNFTSQDDMANLKTYFGSYELILDAVGKGNYLRLEGMDVDTVCFILEKLYGQAVAWYRTTEGRKITKYDGELLCVILAQYWLSVLRAKPYLINCQLPLEYDRPQTHLQALASLLVGATSNFILEQPVVTTAYSEPWQMTTRVSDFIHLWRITQEMEKPRLQEELETLTKEYLLVFSRADDMFVTTALELEALLGELLTMLPEDKIGQFLVVNPIW
jgi:hypothetical protein